ncbi:MAG: male sterility protein-domain-containing protein [Lentinula lateritia]|nr:MAG: male sterility protein-domain-containing protein [Lentinula lateritia]
MHAPDVQCIYALIRGNSDLEYLQTSAFQREGLEWQIPLHTKVKLVRYNPDIESLGITEADQKMLTSTLTHIIHCAWATHHHLAPLSAFTTLIQLTRNLLELALSSTAMNPHFSFVSTTGVSRFKKYSDPALEEVVNFEDIAALDSLQISDWSGYLQSKLIAEQIVLDSDKHTKIESAIIRIGQLTGGVNGSWSTLQWVPALVKSGLITQCLPISDQMVSWLDSNTAAQIVIDLHARAKGVLHVVHPIASPWTNIMKPIASMLKLPLVPYSQWLNKLNEMHQQRMANADQFADQPALALVDFFALGVQEPRSPLEASGLDPVVSISRSKLLSITMASHACQLTESDIKKWCTYWQSTGFLPGFPDC